MPLNLKKIKFNEKKVAFCRFEKIDNKYLITNDVGAYVFLKPAQFKDFMGGKLKNKSTLYKELKEKGFIKDDFDVDRMVETYHCYNNFLFSGPSLHIIVVTLRCNFKCIYCQASSRPLTEKQYDMDIKTAKRVVDNIFKSPSNVITIEFQGGEPLVNWPVVKYITEYARKKNKKIKKKLLISVVTNLSLMTEEKYKFLVEKGVGICTSLDGPEKLQNKNRPWVGGNSYKEITAWIGKIKEEEKETQKKGEDRYHLSALTTISKFSLKYSKEIIEEYIKWGFTGIHLRPLSSLGLSSGEKAKETVGYSAEEFMKFWKKSLNHIIEINLRGKVFFERGASIMLKKILTDENPGFLDLRSPCGAAIGQLLYNYDGKVYTCDEGRMVEDDTFLLGDIKKDSYDKIISNPKVKTMITASTLDNLSCDSCAYKPYCGVCPVLSYALYGNLFPQVINTYHCKIYKEMFKYLFKKLQDKKVKKIFLKWIKQNKG